MIRTIQIGGATYADGSCAVVEQRGIFSHEDGAGIVIHCRAPWASIGGQGAIIDYMLRLLRASGKDRCRIGTTRARVTRGPAH